MLFLQAHGWSGQGLALRTFSHLQGLGGHLRFLHANAPLPRSFDKLSLVVEALPSFPGAPGCFRMNNFDDPFKVIDPFRLGLRGPLSLPSEIEPGRAIS